MTDEPVQRRLAAILAADVVEYSRLMELDEKGTYARIKALRTELITPNVREHNGRIFKTTGDGFLIEFSSAVDAVEHAVTVQRAMADLNIGVSLDDQINFRIGINIGDVIVDDDDVFGDGVNVAARLETLAEPGGICVSGAVFDQISNKTDIHFTDMGLHQVKNISKPVQVYRVAQEGRKEVSERDSALASVLRRPAIAVLPFTNLGTNPDEDYFADGLTEDIISALSAWRSFPVISRNSTFVYKGDAVNVQKVAKDLGARYVLEGSVRHAGKRVRITAQLIDAETDHHLWAEHYDRELEDIFELQDEITQRIAAIIEPELGKAERNRTMLRQPLNMDAWESYQRGTSFLYEFTSDGNAKAREMFERAIDLDSSYSQAYSGLAIAHLRDLNLGYSASRDQTLAQCRQAVRRALALDETDSLAHRVITLMYIWDRNYDLAISHGEKAVTLNPSDGISLILLGVALAYSGKPEEGIVSIEKGLLLNPHDPRNFLYCTWLADACLNANRHEDAIEAARTAIRMRTDYLEPRLIRTSALGHLGRIQEAERELEECRQLDPDFAVPSANWRQFRSPDIVDHLFEGLRTAGWTD